MLGGIQINANTLLAATLFLIVAGICAGIYFLGKHKNLWG